jgi:hypothetical protein
MPDPPIVEWDELKELAKASGCDYSALNPVPSWYSAGAQGLFFSHLDTDYQTYLAGDYDKKAKWDDVIQPRLDTIMAAAPAGCGIAANDNMTIYVDLEDGSIPAATPQPTLMPKEIHTQNIGFRGQIVLTGNFFLNAGGGINKTIYPPPGNWLPVSVTTDINVEGLLVVGGDFYWNGNPILYGSIVVEGGYLGGGTITVYYNYYFPYDGIAGGTFAITAWREMDPADEVLTPTPIP